MQDDNHTTIQEDQRNHEGRTTQKEKKPQKNQSKMTIELYADRLLMPKLGTLLDAWQEDKRICNKWILLLWYRPCSKLGLSEVLLSP
jgi:hypothetical protein